MMNKKLFWILLILIAAGGLAILAYSTPRGMGLVNDSVAYIDGARGLASGMGYGRVAGNSEVKVITHFPPMFSVLLAALAVLGLDAIPAARLLNLALFAGNIVLVGLLARRIARSQGLGLGTADSFFGLLAADSFFGLLAALFFGLSDALIRVHSFALSEPLFLFLSLASMLCLTDESRNRAVLFAAAAGVLAGLAYLTRYVGGALLAAGVLALLLMYPTWKLRLRQAGIFLGSGLVFVLGWSLRNLQLTGSATNRQLIWHPIEPQKIWDGLANFWAFWLPQRFDLYARLPAAFWAGLLVLVGLGILVLVGAFVLHILRRGWQPEQVSPVLLLVALHAPVYLALVIFSMTLADASTLFEERILAPLFVDLLLLGTGLAAQLWQRRRSPYGWILTALALALLLSFADDARKTALELRVDGQGFASSRWTQSATLEAVRALPEVPIYTNRLSALTLLSDRLAYALVGPVDPVTQAPRPGFEQTQNNLHGMLQQGQAVLVVFSAHDLLESPSGGWFRQLVKDIPVVGVYPDGTIYGQVK